MQRYFASIVNNEVKLSSNDEHHFCHVMRAKVGTQIEVVDSNKLFLCEAISFAPLTIKVIKQLDQDVELHKDVTLFFALAKGDKIDFVIQKATEIGVSKIVLVKSSRCIVKMDQFDFERKLSRYQSIAKEASEQSHRLVVPSIVGVVDIKKIPNDLLCDVNFVAYECANSVRPDFSFDNETKSMSILIGSEGGLAEDEVTSLIAQGFKVVSLGKRILRTETAAVYALSVLSYLIEK